MKLCEYMPANQVDCLAVFDSNVPFSFAAQERVTYQDFLQRIAPPYYYFVVRNNDKKIVACGGIKLEPSNHLARLRWNMVSREFHNQKFGTFLTLSRLYWITRYPEIYTVNLYTSQHSFKFYEKIGFVIKSIVPDGIVKGMDEYFMELPMDEDRRQKLAKYAKEESIG